MNENVARRPRFKRIADFNATRLTERDKAIIAVVSRYRFVTTSLILSLVPGSRQNVTRRLQRLYHAGFLDRPHSQLSLRYTGEISEIVYSLTPKSEMGRGSKPVTSLFLAHALAVSEALIRIESDSDSKGARFVSEFGILAIADCDSETRHIQWRVQVKTDTTKERIGIIPDGAFAIERRADGNSPRRRYFFLEVDRGTMPVSRKSLRISSIRRKALAYSRTRRGRVLQGRFNIPGFQVLFVAKSKERVARMEEACKEAAGDTLTSLFLFITQEELRAIPSLLDFIFPASPPHRLEEFGVI